MTVIMQNPRKQVTLFQSWGSKPNSVAGSQHSLKNQKVADFNDGVADDDDLLLARVMEISLAEYKNREKQNRRSVCVESTSSASHLEPWFVDDRHDAVAKNFPGFDLNAGRSWIYPINYPIREYQFNIAQKVMFYNTLVVLPTGLGKTFIAAVAMYNFYRWYPQGKIIFMAPTKPLVAQQIEACHQIMGIPTDDSSEMTGAMLPNERKKCWQSKRVFFLTPQVMINDLSRNACPVTNIKLVVVDEAHKALGNYAYCQVIREVSKATSQFRVLALSATPGNDEKAVNSVLTNLLISHVELRTEESLDIQPYTFQRKLDEIIVHVSGDLEVLSNKFLKVYQEYSRRLLSRKVLYNNNSGVLSKFMLLKAREGFRQNPPTNLPKNMFHHVETDFAITMTLSHAYDLLMQHGIRSFYNFLKDLLDGTKSNPRARSELLRNNDFNEIIMDLDEKYSARESSSENDVYVVGHPKLEKLQEIVLEHFQNFNEKNTSTRIMIFSQYRDSVHEITELLKHHHPTVKVMSFTGHSSTNNRSKGLTQKEQMMVVKQFREGGYNTLVSTCVGEEGLDIGDVDLIVCYDAHKSPIRLVQRMGRTGRKREGRIVMLITEGKELQAYKQAHFKKKLINKVISKGTCFKSLYAGNCRMVPEGLNPVCEKIFMCVPPKKTVAAKYVENKKESKSSKDITQYLGKQSKKKSPFLSVEEEAELEAKYKLDKERMPTFPKLPLLSLKEHHMQNDFAREISFVNWLPWQNTLQKNFLVSHSKQAEAYVDLMRMIGDPDFSYYVQNNFNEEDTVGNEEIKQNKDFDLNQEISCDGKEKKFRKRSKNRTPKMDPKLKLGIKFTVEDENEKCEKNNPKHKKRYIDSSSDEELMRDPFSLDGHCEINEVEIPHKDDCADDSMESIADEHNSIENIECVVNEIESTDLSRMKNFFIMSSQINSERKSSEKPALYIRTPPRDEDLFSPSKSELSPVDLENIINEVNSPGFTTKMDVNLLNSASDNSLSKITPSSVVEDIAPDFSPKDRSDAGINNNFLNQNSEMLVDVAVDDKQSRMSPNERAEIEKSPVFGSSFSTTASEFDPVECVSKPKNKNSTLSENCSLSQLVGMVEMNSVSFANYWEAAGRHDDVTINRKTVNSTRNNGVTAERGKSDSSVQLKDSKSVIEDESYKEETKDEACHGSDFEYDKDLPNFDLGFDLDFDDEDGNGDVTLESVEDVIPPTPPEAKRTDYGIQSFSEKPTKNVITLSPIHKVINPLMSLSSPVKNKTISKTGSPEISFDLDFNLFNDSFEFEEVHCGSKVEEATNSNHLAKYSSPKIPFIHNVKSKMQKNFCSTPCAVVFPMRKEEDSLTPDSVSSTPEFIRSRNKKWFENHGKEKRTLAKSKFKKTVTKSKKKNLIKEFIDDEAEESEDDVARSSSDADVNDSCLDQYEESFVDDSSPAVGEKDMKKIYLRSIRSPKYLPLLPETLKNRHIAHSPIDDDFVDSEYVLDSFCVNNSHVEYEEDSENHHDNSSTVKNVPASDESVHIYRKSVKRRRIIIPDSSSDDETCAGLKLAKNSSRAADFSSNQKIEHLNKKLKFTEEFIDLTETTTRNASHDIVHERRYSDFKNSEFEAKSCSVFPKETTKNASDGTSMPTSIEELIVFVNAKEISGGQQIVSELRYKYSVITVVNSLTGCDYIVSSRLAIERKVMSDISLPANRQQLINRLRNMHWLFERVCLIIEHDRVKNNEASRGLASRSKYYDNLTCLFLHLPIKIFYSSTQEDTALLIRDLTEQEKRKGFGFAFDPTLTEHEEQIFKLYQQIPYLNSIDIYHLVKNFRSVHECVNSSVEQIRDRGQISMQKAKKIIRFFQRNFQDEDLRSEDEFS